MSIDTVNEANWNKYITMVLGGLRNYLTDCILYPFPMIRVFGEGPSLRLCSEIYLDKINDLSSFNCVVYDSEGNVVEDYTDDTSSIVHYIYPTLYDDDIYTVESEVEEKDSYISIFFSEYLKIISECDEIYNYVENFLSGMEGLNEENTTSMWLYTDGDYYNRVTEAFIEAPSDAMLQIYTPEFPGRTYTDNFTLDFFGRTGYMFTHN